MQDDTAAPSPEPSGPVTDEEQPPAGEPLPDGNPPEDAIGYLKVRATTARQAVPVEGIYVTVSRATAEGEVLIDADYTGRDGSTRVFALPTVDGALSLFPGDPVPYVFYNVHVRAPGYFQVANKNIPIYDGVTAIQPVELIPLPDKASPGDVEEFVYMENGPQELD